VLGVWGTFDVENYGDHLFPRVAAHELARRLEAVTVRAYSPLGWLHPTRMDGGEPAEPLGPWHEARLDELAAELDCVLIGGGEIIHTRDELLAPAYGISAADMRALTPSRYFIEGLGPEREERCPVLWHAVGVPFDPIPEDAARMRAALATRPYVAVRDDLSRARLLAAGVDAEVAVVPDSAFLAPRILAPPLLRKRREYLQAMGWYPADGNAMVVQGNRDLVGFAPDLAAVCVRLRAEHPDLRVVLAPTGVCHGDDELASDLFDRLRGAGQRDVFRLPREVGVEDLAAAISGAGVFVGSSLHGCITALAFGRSFVPLNLTSQSKLDGLGRLVESEELVVRHPDDLHDACTVALKSTPDRALRARLQHRVDEHFDRVAAIVERSADRSDAHARSRAEPSTYPAEGLRAELRGARAAHEALTRRVRAERRRLADHVDALHEAHAAATARLEAAEAAAEAERRRADHAEREAAALADALGALRATKTFRYLDVPRRAYARLLRWRR
jgi:lipopolysaccharide transport system ATP-binding protein